MTDPLRPTRAANVLWMLAVGVPVNKVASARSPAAFQDILKWRRCSCDIPGFIEPFCDTPRLLSLPIRV